MAVRIRMKRLGRRHRPFFRICVMDSRKQRDGKAIEEVGYYDPMVRDKSRRASLKMERIEYWMSVGALPSEKVAALIKKVKTNKFGTPAEPPPLTPPKEPPPKPEPAAEQPSEAAAADETAAQESPAAEAAASETSAGEGDADETKEENDQK